MVEVSGKLQHAITIVATAFKLPIKINSQIHPHFINHIFDPFQLEIYRAYVPYHILHNLPPYLPSLQHPRHLLLILLLPLTHPILHHIRQIFVQFLLY